MKSDVVRLILEEKDDIMDRMDNALDQLEQWQRTVLYLDIDNNYEDRNQLLLDNVGISTQLEINRYLQRLKNKVKELVETGEYKEKHKGNNKPTLRGF